MLKGRFSAILAALLACLLLVSSCSSIFANRASTGKDYIKFTSESYELEIPSDWAYATGIGEQLSFTKKGENVGGVEITAYNPEGLSSILPKFTGELIKEELKGYTLEGYKIKLELSPPAASSKTGTSQQLRYVFISGSSAYHIFFDSGQVSDAEAEAVAKSFKVIKAEREIKTDTGTYTGQVDNNSVEIRISGVQDDTKAYRVFKISDEVRPTFEKLSLKKDEAVKFEYYEKGEEQPVLVSIERIDGSNGEPEIVTLTGKINFTEVESGYYELGGYRLTGDFDFEKYQNQLVWVKGEVDNSPSIYMVKTLKVSEIEVIEGK